MHQLTSWVKEVRLWVYAHAHSLLEVRLVRARRHCSVSMLAVPREGAVCFDSGPPLARAGTVRSVRCVLLRQS